MPQRMNSNEIVSKNGGQARGKNLRKLMIDSAEYGDQFRAEHEGQDVVKSAIKHENRKTRKLKNNTR